MNLGLEHSVKISIELAEYLSIDPKDFYKPSQIVHLFNQYTEANGLKDKGL
jgi:hypothetical protein